MLIIKNNLFPLSHLQTLPLIWCSCCPSSFSPVTVIFSLSCHVTCSPSPSFLFLRHSSVPSHPLYFMTGTQSLLCLIFSLSFALSPSSSCSIHVVLARSSSSIFRYPWNSCFAFNILHPVTLSLGQQEGEGYMRLDEGRSGKWLWQKRENRMTGIGGIERNDSWRPTGLNT